MQNLLDQLKTGKDLSTAQMNTALNVILSPDAAPDQTRNFLIALSDKGESPEEIAAAAAYLRQHAQPINAPAGAVDCCGTGGDVRGTYNISTAVALLCAACGIPVAKHGNRAASSKSGAADVLEAMGVNLTVPREGLEEALKRFNFAFLMAPQHHQILKPLAPIRKSLGQPTIFNLLGPLANPAGTKIQLIGVYNRKWLQPMAKALKTLGTQRAWVVHGRDGLDEITLTDTTEIVTLEEDGTIASFELSPEDVGLKRCDLKDLQGGTAEENAVALQDLMRGADSAYRDITLLNCAAVLKLAGKCQTLTDGLERARNALTSDKMTENFEAYRDFTRGIS